MAAKFGFGVFSQLYYITDLGREFLKIIHVYKKIEMDFDHDETASETVLDVSEWAIDFYKSEKNKDRRPSIGYIPGNIKEFDNTIREYMEVIEKGVSYNKILDYTKKKFGVSESSLRSFMTTMKNIGFLERKTEVLYKSTPLANAWLEKHSIIDLLFIIQSKFLFVFELLKYTEDEGKTYKELAAIAKVSNGFQKENVDEIRKRISFLKTGKLVKNVSADRYGITNRGKLLLNMIDVDVEKSVEKKIEVLEESEDSLSEFLTELRISARDSNNFERLERNVAKAFEYLGFSAKWIGGPGNTDVLIHAQSAPKYSFSVTVDAKSTQSGNVADIDFDTLVEHKKKHEAEFAAVVGGNFKNERLIKRAVKHGVVLINIDSLEKLIRAEKEVPLEISAYREIFKHPGLIDISVLNKKRNHIIRYGKLLRSVMKCLVEENKDPVTGGVLQAKDIYRSLRDSKEFECAPTCEEISNMLEVISSPLIGCAEKTEDGYCAIGSVADAAKKFEFYFKVCNSDNV